MRNGKKFSVLILAGMLLLICLTGCEKSLLSSGGYRFEQTRQDEYIVSPDGQTTNGQYAHEQYAGETFLFKEEECVVFQGQEYPYSFDGNRENYTVSVTFPEGEYTYRYTDGTGIGSVSDLNAIIPDNKDVLIAAVVAVSLSNKMSFNGGQFLIGLLMAGIGLLGFFSPHSAWYISKGWYYKNTEPSDAALQFYRILGAGFFIIAIVLIIMAFSG